MNWPVRSMDRPRPPVVTPPEPSTQEAPRAPPSDAIVLFDGSSFDEWEALTKRVQPREVIEPPWKLQDGYMEVHPPRADLTSRREFGNCQIHVEWATPSVVEGDGQGRGNSGVILLGQGEIQVLDSYQNDTYPDGQAGAIYGKFPPLVNPSRRPGEWQTYDIVFFSPSVENGAIRSCAQLTVFYNGLLIHHAIDPGGSEERVKILLQDHNNPTRFRNIWVRELKGYDGQE